MTTKGIDVSKWQGTIDWEKVAKDGVEFAILRAGYGKLSSQKDQYFETNYMNAKATSLPVGAYWYSYATNPEAAKLEAEACLACIKDKKFDLPIYYDLEEKDQKAIGKVALTKVAIAFCEVIEKAGYKAGIYGNKDFLTNYLDMSQLEGKYSIWLAQYNSQVTYQGKYDIWQFSESETVSGISGKVDMNYLYNTSLIVKKSSDSSANSSNSSKTSSESTKTYKVVKDVAGYSTALDAKNKKNKKGTVKAGTLYIFNEKDGMINVTSKKGVAGSWINPSENVISTAVAKKYHTVKRYDTVSKLATQYGSTIKQIKDWNKLDSKYLIKVGQKLRVK